MDLETGQIQESTKTRLFEGLFGRFFLKRGWMLLAMAAVLSFLAGLALHESFLQTMEGTIGGALVLVCISIWCGSFNSIRAISREREEGRGQYRQGRSAFSYIAAHILFQLLLCLAQTVLILLAAAMAGMKLSGQGLMTGWLFLDLGITLMLTACCADMLCLWISSFCPSSAAALTILPFVLVFQILLSGVLLSLPSSLKPVSALTVTAPGYRAAASLTDINTKSVATVQGILSGVDGVEINGRITVGQILDSLSDADNPSVSKLRSVKVGNIATIGDMLDDLIHEDKFRGLRERKLLGNLRIGDILVVLDDAEAIQDYKNKKVGMETTVGRVVDFLASSKELESLKDEGFTINTSLGDVLSMMGREKAQKLIEEQVSNMKSNPDYAHAPENVRAAWIALLVYLLVFAGLSAASVTWTVCRLRRGGDLNQ